MIHPAIGVLVTRAAQQAPPLANALTACGASVFLLPAIEPVGCELEAAHPALATPNAFAWIIFVSVNAVRFGAHLCDGKQSARVISMGPATSAALKQAGIANTVLANPGSDSEALLQSPDLSHVDGAHILIVKGMGGRALLGDRLRERGATVTYADVYERSRANPSPHTIATIEHHWRQGDIAVVTATSGDVLRRLQEILSPTGRQYLSHTALLVSSARVGALARDQGLLGPLIIASQPDDAGLVAAFKRWQIQSAC
jgi:uroporphyrinogen-III synthase